MNRPRISELFTLVLILWSPALFAATMGRAFKARPIEPQIARPADPSRPASTDTAPRSTEELVHDWQKLLDPSNDLFNPNSIYRSRHTEHEQFYQLLKSLGFFSDNEIERIFRENPILGGSPSLEMQQARMFKILAEHDLAEKKRRR